MLKTISLFSGAGGLDLGLEAAGFETCLATDIDEHSCLTLERNKRESARRGKPFLRSAKILRADVTLLDSKTLLREAGIQDGELALLAGGPPCQAFSVFGQRKGKSDPRGQLVFDYLRLLSELRPKAFVFENVYGLLTIEKGAIFEELKKRLANPRRGLKYQLSVHRLEAANFGVPQFRDRVFIIGSLEGYSIPTFEQICAASPDVLATTLRWRTVADGLRGLPGMGKGGLANHTGRVHSKRIQNRYDKMEYGQRDHFTRINRLDPKRPSYTIIVGSDAGGGKGTFIPIRRAK